MKMDVKLSRNPLKDDFFYAVIFWAGQQHDVAVYAEALFYFYPVRARTTVGASGNNICAATRQLIIEKI